MSPDKIKKEFSVNNNNNDDILSGRSMGSTGNEYQDRSVTQREMYENDSRE